MKALSAEDRRTAVIVSSLLWDEYTGRFPTGVDMGLYASVHVFSEGPGMLAAPFHEPLVTGSYDGMVHWQQHANYVLWEGEQLGHGPYALEYDY